MKCMESKYLYNFQEILKNSFEYFLKVFEICYIWTTSTVIFVAAYQNFNYNIVNSICYPHIFFIVIMFLAFVKSCIIVWAIWFVWSCFFPFTRKHQQLKLFLVSRTCRKIWMPRSSKSNKVVHKGKCEVSRFFKL